MAENPPSGAGRVLSLGEAVQTAVASYRAGNFEQTEGICRHILDQMPDQPNALDLLGMVCLHRNDVGEAIRLFGRAVELTDSADAWAHLGHAHFKGEDWNSAETAFRAAIEKGPAVAAHHFNLGKALTNQHRYEESARAFGQALALDSGMIEALAGLGLALFNLARHEEAVAALQSAIKRDPALGQIYYFTLGRALISLKRPKDARDVFEAALARAPNSALAHAGLGAACIDLDELGRAVQEYREAIRLDPNSDQFHLQIGMALGYQGRADAARLHFERAIEIKPEDPAAHLNRAISRLLLGEYEEGWAEYEWRWETDNFGFGKFARYNAAPRWDGRPMPDRTLFVFREQGIGDIIQFSRYVLWAAERVGTVIFECPRLLHRLFRTFGSRVMLIDNDAAVPPHDAVVPLLSLPFVHGTTAATVPAAVPYVHAEPELAAKWAPALAAPAGALKIGLVWQGNPDHARDRLRSIPLKILAPLLDIPGTAWFCLQKDPPPELFAGVPAEVAPRAVRTPAGEGISEFTDTAAIAAGLDLIVSVDSSVAHLAGAMARPVWVLLALSPDWRWLFDREDSPWYPTMRLFRQTSFKEWESVVRRVKRALEEQIAARRR